MPRVSACPDVRKAVLDVAQRLIQTCGYKKMTIDDIATEVGIGKATIYGYFANKQEVGLAVLDLYHQQIQAEMERIAAEPAPPERRIRDMIMDRVLRKFDIAQQHRSSFDQCLDALRPLLLARRDHYMEVEAQIFGKVLEEGMRCGTFLPGEVRTLAAAIVTCTAGLLPLNLSATELESREQVIQKTRNVCDLLLRAIEAPAGTGRPNPTDRCLSPTVP